MLTDREVADMRDTLEQTFPDECTIRRSQVVPDGQGGETETWSDLATVPCRLSPQSQRQSDEVEEGDRITALTYRVVTVAHDTDVTAADRLVINGETLEVQGLRAPRSWELSRRIECRRVS